MYLNFTYDNILLLILFIYIILLSPNIPVIIEKLFNNIIFKFIILFIIISKGNDNPKLAIIMMIAFILTLDYIYINDSKKLSNKIKTIQLKYNEKMVNLNQYRSNATFLPIGCRCSNGLFGKMINKMCNCNIK